MKHILVIAAVTLQLFAGNMTKSKLENLSDMIVEAKISHINKTKSGYEITIKNDDSDFIKGEDRLFQKSVSLIVYDYKKQGAIDFEKFAKEKRTLIFYLKAHGFEKKYQMCYTLADPIYGVQFPRKK